jgi:alginate O-acetyltransferase complex protein AlgI
VLATFHLVLLAWVFFRARSLADAWYILKSIAATGLRSGLADVGQPASTLVLCGLLILLLEGVHGFQAGIQWLPAWPRLPVAVRWAAYLVLFLCVLNLRPVQVSPFIYFQF